MAAGWYCAAASQWTPEDARTLARAADDEDAQTSLRPCRLRTHARTSAGATWAPSKKRRGWRAKRYGFAATRKRVHGSFFVRCHAFLGARVRFACACVQVRGALNNIVRYKCQCSLASRAEKMPVKGCSTMCNHHRAGRNRNPKRLLSVT